MIRTTIIRAVLVGVLGGLAAAGQEGSESSKSITVTGRAVGNTAAAAEEAKLDALREAVRRVCGSFINSQTETQDFAVVRDKVLEQPVGFARVVKVTREPKVLDGDITEVKLVAEVFPVRFEHAWAEFAHIKQREGNPRCILIIIEDDDVDDDKPAASDGPCQTAMEDFFLSQGVQLMDKGTTDSVKARDLKLAAVDNDAKKAAAVGLAFKADVVVIGRAEAKRARPITIAGQTLQRWSISLNARVIQTDSGAVLVAKAYRPEKPVAISSGASGPGLVKFARECAPTLLLDIGAAWRQRATAGKTIQVRLEPCSRGQFKAIQAEMIKQKGVTGGEDGFKLRELVKNVATVEVNWKYDLDQLADRLEELKAVIDGVPLKIDITEQSANRIVGRLRPAVTAPILPAAEEPED